MTEFEIIQGCKRKDAQCQRALVDRYSGLLFSICRRYGNDDFMAQESLQEGLIRIFKYIESFDPAKGSFVSWMKRIVTNESIKILKKNKREVVIDLHANEITSYDLTALDNLQEEELIRLIQKLPPGYREVFNMYVIDGYSHKEIGEILKISGSTSRSQLTRAKKLLQQKISMIENLQLCRRKI